MNVKDLSTMIYDKLPEVDILKYEDTWLNSSFYYQTALKSYWFFKHKIDADKILKSPAYTDKMKDLIRIIESCRNLEQVTLVARHRDITLTELRLLIKVICDRPLIKRLYLQTFCLYKEELLQLGRCSMLEVLSINVIVEDDDLGNLFENCPKLQSLTLIEKVIQPYSLSLVQRLIENNGESIPPLCGACLMKLPGNMVELKVRTSDYITVKYVRKTLKRSRNLEVLYLDKIRNGASFMYDLEELVPFLQDLTLGPSVGLHYFGRFTYLKRLCLFDLSEAQNIQWITRVADNCNALEDVTLRKLQPGVTAIHFIILIRNLTKLFLDGLDIHPLPYYSTEITFLKYCVKLEHLRIRNLKFTNKDALSVITHCRDSKYIEIKGCPTTIELILEAAYEVERRWLSNPNLRIPVLKMKMADYKESDKLVQQIRQELQSYPMLELDIPTC